MVIGRKENCWEFKLCGRQPQGRSVESLGICPASIEKRLDSVHGGTNAGRACWVVAGTFCGGEVQGTFAEKLTNCETCEFYQKLKADEGKEFKYSTILLNMLG